MGGEYLGNKYRVFPLIAADGGGKTRLSGWLCASDLLHSTCPGAPAVQLSDLLIEGFTFLPIDGGGSQMLLAVAHESVRNNDVRSLLSNPIAKLVIFFEIAKFSYFGGYPGGRFSLSLHGGGVAGREECDAKPAIADSDEFGGEEGLLYIYRDVEAFAPAGSAVEAHAVEGFEA